MTESKKKVAGTRLWTKKFTYDVWMEEQGIPVHRGYYIPDLRMAGVGYWESRGCNAAFVQLVGQEGVTSTRIMEIPPGRTLSFVSSAFDEIVYSLNGNGITQLEIPGGGKQSFEWQPHSMFTMPRHHAYRLTNADGTKPVRLLFFNYLPMAMSAVLDPEFFFDNPMKIVTHYGEDFYSEA